MISVQERFLVKSGLWWHAYGNQNQKNIMMLPNTFVFSMSRGYRNGSIDMYAFMHKRVDPLGSNCIN